MAYEQPLFNLSFTTAKDLSSYQFQVVNLTTGDQITAGLTSSTNGALGILQDKPTSGMQGSVMVLGVTKVKTAGAVSCGQTIGLNLTTTDYPNMVVALTTETSLAKAPNAIGRALGGSVQAGDIIPALINFVPSSLGTS